MKEIISLSNPTIKYYEKLYDKKTREAEGLYIVEGYHLVEEARKVGVLKTVLILSDEDKINGVENFKVTIDIIKKLSKTKSPQSIIGICNIKDGVKDFGNRILICDDINDPGNFGTLLRSALGFGFKDVIISNNTVDLYNDKVIRATQGAHFKLNIIRSNLLEIIKDLKARNYMIIGTSLKDAINLQEIKKTKKYAVILGNEAVGVNPELLCETDKNVRIEISRELESLNVSIAGAIIMYYLSELKLEI